MTVTDPAAPRIAPRPPAYRCLACGSPVRVDHNGLSVAHYDASARAIPGGAMCPVHGRVPWRYGTPSAEEIAGLLGPDVPADDGEVVFHVCRPGRAHAIVKARRGYGTGPEGVSWLLWHTSGAREFIFPPEDDAPDCWYFRPLDTRTGDARPWGAP